MTKDEEDAIRTANYVEGTLPYGFRWGPLVVTRLAHIQRRGYVLEIATKHETMQVYVSEKGQKIRAMTSRKVGKR